MSLLWAPQSLLKQGLAATGLLGHMHSPGVSNFETAIPRTPFNYVVKFLQRFSLQHRKSRTVALMVTALGLRLGKSSIASSLRRLTEQ